MANVFLENDHSEIETAILLEKAYRVNIENAVAYTDGDRVFVNTDDNLEKILPDYNKGMLKWLLWHEEYHKQLRHHNRFFKYLHDLEDQECMDKFQVTKDEVNIIMDILVHDSLSKMFPELVETALKNLAQMRNRNSLGYTFKTNNLEDMLDEYAKYKHKDDKDKGKSKSLTEDEGEDTEDKDKGKGKSKDKDKSKDESKDSKGDDGTEKGHSEGGGTSKKESPAAEESEQDGEDKGEHDKTDWSKLEDIDNREFIEEDEADEYVNEINRVRHIKLNLGKLTQAVSSLATTIKARTYRMPSVIQAPNNIILKGSLPGRCALYLVFDASGSMSGELEAFKTIINKSIPLAKNVPCEWFAGYKAKIRPYKEDCDDGYYKGTFKDLEPVYASSGYDDDGDRTIELCLEAEKKGYAPIGVTDGGGGIYRPKVLKQLKKTILIGHSKSWLDQAKKINNNIQTLYLDIRGGDIDV